MRRWPARSLEYQPVINRIMLRFRPIAPKPIGGEATSGAAEEYRGSAAGKRVKRKYVRVRGRQSKECARRKVREGEEERSGVEEAPPPPPEKVVVTLQLLPERSESDDNSAQKIIGNWSADLWSADDDVMNYDLTADSGDGTADLRSAGSVVETWIVVERVTDRFAGVGLGFSDKEKIHNLERDTCPGFVTDWTNNVIWVNDAYKRMVAEDDAEVAAAEKGVGVRLVVKEEIPYFYPSFACRVRVIQRKGHGQKWNKIVPCDVWRMEFNGFAWKLDVDTALSLSL